MVENVSPTATWAALSGDPMAHMVDVRTTAEWAYVGLPDLVGIGKRVVTIAWQVFPAMQVNPVFIDELRAAGFTPEHKIFFAAAACGACTRRRRRSRRGSRTATISPTGSRGRPTPTAIAAPWPAGRSRACRGGKGRRIFVAIAEQNGRAPSSASIGLFSGDHGPWGVGAVDLNRRGRVAAGMTRARGMFAPPAVCRAEAWRGVAPPG